MSDAKAWRPLPLAGSSNLPTLLTFFELGTSNYSIQLTDMANVWEEVLDRKAICIRAWGENTSIDPSDTPENMTKFLSSLASALDATQPGHDETSLRLSPGSKDKTGEDGITIQVTCRLPGFPDLKWPFYLKKRPASSIATSLVVPLTEALYTRKTEVESLIQLLKQKDSVISKLSDKLEATGTGLESVFTALAGRKSVSRSVAESKIKGLGAFDERTWTAKLKDDDGGPSNLNDLAQAVFGGTGMQYQATMQIDSSSGLDQWWRDFRPAAGLAIRDQRPEAQRQRTPSPAAKTRAADDDDDEFQVQSTPPHLKSSAKRSSPIPVKGESPEPVAQPSKATQPAKKIGGKLGAIGGKKPSPPPRPPTPKESSPPPPAADDDETASETASDADETASLPDEIPSTPPPAPSPAKAAPKKGGLGRIGGPSAAKSKPADEDQEVKPPAPRKLGVIGNKPKAASSTTSTAVDGEASRGRPATRQQEEEEAQARETSQERADRKREELKRELEKKAAAGPAKKKRKF